MAKDIDQQLEHLVRETEELAARPEAVQPVVQTVQSGLANLAPKRDKGAVNLGMLAGLLGMVIVVVAVFTIGFKDAAVYAMSADKLMSRSQELTGRKVRVEGELVPGTLVKRDDPCEYKFTMQSAGVPLDVRYPQCVIPDTFRDRPEGGVQVTVEGALNKQGAFDATLVMAKCASKYDPTTHTFTESAAKDGSQVEQREGGY